MLDSVEPRVELRRREQARGPRAPSAARARWTSARTIEPGSSSASRSSRAESEPARRCRIENPASAERRRVPQDEAVASSRDDGRGEAKLREAVADPDEPSRDLGRAVVHVEPGVVGDRLQLLELDVDPVADRIRARLDEGVAAPEGRPLDARQRERDALARVGPLDRLVVHLDAPYAHLGAGRLGAQLVALADRPDQSVPVTTVPIPCSVKARST